MKSLDFGKKKNNKEMWYDCQSAMKHIFIRDQRADT